ncbi:hypothetical protein ACQY0O_007661 [Thecaphora frezii]
MSGRQGPSEAHHWAHQQAVPSQPTGSQSNDPSTMSHVSFAHQGRQAPPGTHFRDHPLPSPSSSYGTNYIQARQPSNNGAPMNYGIAPPMPGPHVQDSAGTAAPAYSAPPPLGQYGGGMASGFQYGSQDFYGNPQAPPAADALAPQHPYYGSHHQGAAPIDPNVQGHSAYPGAGGMDGGVVAPNGHFHPGEADMMMPGAYGGFHGVGIRPKRKQVKNACVNCQKACKKCDEGRPCSRCVKYGLTDTCQDSARKERRRGVKRGPYKRRATTGSQPASSAGLGVSAVIAYGRESHIGAGGRSMDGISSAPEETQLSSPGFGGQMIPPRPPLSLGTQANISASWQSTSSPSLRGVDEDRDGRFPRALGGAPLGTNTYYPGYEGQEGGPSPYDRSSSAPIPGPGSFALSPIGSLSRLQPPPGFSQGSGHQLPSLSNTSSSSSNFNGLYTPGGNRPLVSPLLHSGPSGSYLNPVPAGHTRIHSDSSFGSAINSAGTSSSTMSPRTPLNSQGTDYQMMSPPTSGKFSASYVPPQPTVPIGASTFLSQDAMRPFPLKMPKALQRNRAGTASSFLEAQASRMKAEADSGHADNTGGSNLAPIRQEASPAGQRSSPYLGASGHHIHSGSGATIDDLSSRRLGTGSGLTPRIELPSYPIPISSSAAALPKRESDVSGSLGLA